MGVNNRIRWGVRVTPELISDTAGQIVDAAGRAVHCFRKNEGPRDLFAVLLLSAQMEGWDFEAELEEGRRIAARPNIAQDIPTASRKGKPGEFVKGAVQSVRGDADAINALIDRMPCGFNRFVLFNMLKELEDKEGV